ncbi:restriction endonuclease subunit S [Acinetobacter bereziniae]|uniref:Restriction endonuclease subunit S n=1 Tax=Acinetobacter bereziniae TaxID=106648 RepID=A0A8I1AMU9_ACIBZ|nr:restriction endonuclease subunit S [Acinetobacter bereziniae]QQC84026.1 restriction endonuclease subunit S [Acinetobacter bereziniae]UUN97207.1 restriction endonuclease subunit S [Acinetobacter bereziniae]
MSEHWISTTLGEYILFKNGKSSPSRDIAEDIPVYGSNGIIGFSSESNAEEDSLIIGRVGSYCGSVYHSKKKCWVTDNAIIGLPKVKGESEFWYFLLTKLQLNSYRSGSGQPLVNQSTLNSIPVEIPKSPSVRQAIGKQLFSFENKIYLNNQINQTLESIAQAIFKSWFIDFEPVRAKIAAKQNGEDPELAAMCAISGKSEEELQQMPEEDLTELQATAALFPDELVESELGEVPKGWSITKVDDILNRIKIKKRFKKNDVNSFGRTFVLEQGSNVILGFHNEEGSIPASKEEPAFIFGDHTCITKLMLSNFDVSENVIAVTGKKRNSYWTYYAIKDLQKFQEYRRHWMELTSKQVVIADINLTDYFAKKVKILHEDIEYSLRENLVLMNLRNTLLPKLLSGEISVSSFQEDTND